MEGAGAKAAADATRQDAIASFMIDMLFVFSESEKYEKNTIYFLCALWHGIHTFHH